ncbi:hypothetical protein AVEN_98020-1 [Araneus ventricosus]|uniref:Uncharacterized protein n=1 Tax=Araneus ventricosus TaxID=182803 RepID=A0A4Y2G6M4_ARAVE|nr:hypothetical protein AVEN_98020-1 [Araneus ventricosus]
MQSNSDRWHHLASNMMFFLSPSYDLYQFHQLSPSSGKVSTIRDGSSDLSIRIQIKAVRLKDATCYSSEIVARETVHFFEPPLVRFITFVTKFTLQAFIIESGN